MCKILEPGAYKILKLNAKKKNNYYHHLPEKEMELRAKSTECQARPKKIYNPRNYFK